jgi:hypothetical protein
VRAPTEVLGENVCVYSYTVFGLEVSSEMPIPELVESKGEPDVVVRLERWTGTGTGCYRRLVLIP